MWRYYDLLSFCSARELRALRQAVNEGQNPRDVKIALAVELVSRFHGAAAGEAAQADFIARFQRGAMPDEMPEVTVSVGAGLAISHVLRQAGLTASTSESMRMIDQGGVRLNGERVSDKGLVLPAGNAVVLQVGKRKFVRVSLV
jgi:tyrosyl-tRNA synthetase